jgi:predicted nuclease with TOPRIM domain
MTERDRLIQEIAELEAERERLGVQKEILDTAFWLLPVGPNSKAIDTELDDILERLDAISDQVGTLKNRLDELEQDQGMREARLDREYGAWATGP